MLASASNGHRILIAEEDHQIRDLLTQLLHLEGYETDEAATLDAALTKVDEHIYDVVLTDLFGPVPKPSLDGIRRLQEHCHPIPVGILTGWGVDQEEIERAGFAFVMPKPFDIDVVLRKVADLLNPAFTPAQHQQAQLIRRYLKALSQGDWEGLRALCIPTLRYYLLTRSAFTTERGFVGFERFLDYARLVYQRLPGFQIEHAVIFQHSKGLIARYNLSWQKSEGQRRWITGSMVCHFRGERISQIGEALNTNLLRKLLELPQEGSGV